MRLTLLFIPIISALIGWFTNFLAVKMLFHPRKKVSLGLFSIQGIFPKRQAAIAEKIGHMVANELISIEEIGEKINSTENQALILNELDQKLEHYFSHKLAEKFPLIGTFLSGSMKTSIKEEFLKEFASFIPEVMNGLVKNIGNSFDLKGNVQKKVESFSTEKLEQILMDILRKEFRFIEILGAVIGFIIGCLQIALLNFL